MSTPHVPFKTPLGHDELRTRTHRLSQRHRTILLLVDGRRPLAEVLNLAQKAGSAISHFEDVLRLGLVEMPIEVAAPDPVMTEPGALPTLHTTSIEVDVQEPVSAYDAMMAPPAAEGPQQPGPLDAVPAPALEATLAPASDDAHATVAPDTASSPVEHSASPMAQAAPVEAATKPEPSLPAASVPAPLAPAIPGTTLPPPGFETLARPRRAGGRPAPAPVAPAEPLALSPLDAVPPAPPAGATQTVPRADDALMQQVRSLLTHTVRQNPPPFASRLPGRLAGAQTLDELRDLVLHIERYLSAARRPHSGRGALEQARELLGLGNTVVAEDTRSSYADDDDDFNTTR